MEYSYVDCRSALSPSRLPELKYSLNPYSGCEHGCLYCYVRGFFKDRAEALNWGNFVRAKRNIVEVLTHQLDSLPVGIVGVSTITDPYQPMEEKLHLTRKCIEILASRAFPVSLQTKSALVLKDIDVISSGTFDLGVTITTLDTDVARTLQPHASSPDAIAQVVEEFARRGVPTWIFLGPIIPEITDGMESIHAVVEFARKSNSKLLYDKLNLKPWVLDSLGPFLERERPSLAERLPKLLRRESLYWQGLKARIEHLCRELEVECQSAFP